MSVGNELPGSNERPDGQAGAADQNRKTEEIVNYEISRITKTEVIEGGRVNRISVAVVVDGTYGKNDKGETVYQPRTKEEIDRIAALVRTAIGFDRSAATRSRSSISASPKRRSSVAEPQTGGHPAIHQGRHHARRRARRDGAARVCWRCC